MTSDALSALTALLEADRLLVWTQEEAIALAVEAEALAPKFGCHVALTGGCLYKAHDGSRRKDCDLMFYRIRQVDQIDQEGLFKALETIGIKIVKSFTGMWVVKAEWNGKPMDLFFPEEDKVRRAEEKPVDCDYVLPSESHWTGQVEPATCPKCYKPIFYSPNTDDWRHNPFKGMHDPASTLEPFKRLHDPSSQLAAALDALRMGGFIAATRSQ